MIEKPEQYYDTRRYQLYYQWRESEHYIHQEPIYDRTRDYIESLEAQNAKLRELVRTLAHCASNAQCEACPINGNDGIVTDADMCDTAHERMRELGVEVDG